MSHFQEAPSRVDRHPSESYEDVLNKDTRAVPAYLREQEVRDLGTKPILASRYTDAGFFQQELKHVWPKVWQMACREEEIPSVGSYYIFEIVGKSFIVTRTGPDTIKAFYNSCLHRGRKLVTQNGCRAEFRCPFHGISWNTDGTFKDSPIGWDFPQWKNEQEVSLPEAKVDRWGGFVFINMDLNAKPLAFYLGSLVEHFKAYDFESRYQAVHVSKIIRANWKVVAEAFMESHHTYTTHPQLLPFMADVNSQYDFLNDFVTRQFSASGVASPMVAGKNYSPTDILRAMAGPTSGGSFGDKNPDSVVHSRRLGPVSASVTVPEGTSARAFAADLVRKTIGSEDGWDYSNVSDAEMLDPMLYNLWPNMSFWAGYAPNIAYRWRPNGLDHESCIMDVIILKRVPKGGQRPAPARERRIAENERWVDAPELGTVLGGVLEQDMGNLALVQEGLHSSGNGLVHFGRYSEMRIRQLHALLDRYIGPSEWQTK